MWSLNLTNMTTFKKYLKAVLFPSIKTLLLFTFITIIILLVIFLNNLNKTIIAYALYPITAYTLLIDLIFIINKMRGIKDILDRYSFFHRYNTDIDFKANVSLHISLYINLIYSLYKAFVGIYYHSLWFGTVAFYYIILSSEQFFLLQQANNTKNKQVEAYKKYSQCGYILLTLTIAIIGMSVYMIHDNQVTTYPGYIIYAAAGYTFYNFILAIISTFKYRKATNPLYHASKMITLAKALVSVFTLQTAMFAEFGKSYIQQRTMNIITGFVVLIIVLLLAIFMIIKAKRAICQKTAKQEII